MQSCFPSVVAFPTLHASVLIISCLSTFQGRRIFFIARDAADPKLRTRTAVPYQPCGTRDSGW